MHSLQYDRRPDGHIGVRVRMRNLGSLSGKGGKNCEEQRRMIDMCCLYEVRSKGQGIRLLGMGERDIGLGGLKKEGSWCCGCNGEEVAV